jgi:small subunit ribosomal protein S16
MVKIRLSRAGTKGRPFYHVIVADQRSARDGRNIERVGFFNPVAAGKEVSLQLDLPRVDYWLGVGAQATEKTASLIKRARKSQAAAAVAA